MYVVAVPEYVVGPPPVGQKLVVLKLIGTAVLVAVDVQKGVAVEVGVEVPPVQV